MKKLAVLMVGVGMLVAACGGGGGTKHIDVTINGKTIKTTPPAECARAKKANAAVDAYNKGIDAWNALSQAERDASHSPAASPSDYTSAWLAAHGYPTVQPSVGPATVGC